MLQKMLITVAVVFGVSAHAQSQSEFFYQTPAGKSDLTPKIGYLTSTTKAKTAGAAEVKANGLLNTGIAYEYGINEMFSLEGALYFMSLENDQTPKLKQSGLQDPTK